MRSEEWGMGNGEWGMEFIKKVKNNKRGSYFQKKVVTLQIKVAIMIWH